MPSSRLWLAGAAAMTIAAATTAAAAGPSSPSHLASAPAAPSAVLAGQAVGEAPAATTPDFGRRGRKGSAQAPAPVAKVALDQSSNGQTITVKPGTEIDVTLTPDSGQRWSPPRSDHPSTVGRAHQGGWWHRGGGRQADTPDRGGRRGANGGTQAVFYARQGGTAKLSSSEHQGGFMFLMRKQSGGKAWGVTVNVSGPAPAAKPRPGTAPAPHAPAPGAPAAPALDVPKLLAPVTSAAQRLPVALPRL